MWAIKKHDFFYRASYYIEEIIGITALPCPVESGSALLCNEQKSPPALNGHIDTLCTYWTTGVAPPSFNLMQKYSTWLLPKLIFPFSLSGYGHDYTGWLQFFQQRRCCSGRKLRNCIGIASSEYCLEAVRIEQFLCLPDRILFSICRLQKVHIWEKWFKVFLTCINVLFARWISCLLTSMSGLNCPLI